MVLAGLAAEASTPCRALPPRSGANSDLAKAKLNSVAPRSVALKSEHRRVPKVLPMGRCRNGRRTFDSKSSAFGFVGSFKSHRSQLQTWPHSPGSPQASPPRRHKSAVMEHLHPVFLLELVEGLRGSGSRTVRGKIANLRLRRRHRPNPAPLGHSDAGECVGPLSRQLGRLQHVSTCTGIPEQELLAPGSPAQLHRSRLFL